MTYYCAICGNRINLFKVKIKDGFICGPCGNRLPQKYYNIKEDLDGEQLKMIVKWGEDYDNSRPDMIQQALIKYQETVSKKNSKEREDDEFAQVRHYKQLYDDGIITEEEYECKRKEILKLRSNEIFDIDVSSA